MSSPGSQCSLRCTSGGCQNLRCREVRNVEQQVINRFLCFVRGQSLVLTIILV